MSKDMTSLFFIGSEITTEAFPSNDINRLIPATCATFAALKSCLCDQRGIKLLNNWKSYRCASKRLCTRWYMQHYATAISSAWKVCGAAFSDISCVSRGKQCRYTRVLLIKRRSPDSMQRNNDVIGMSIVWMTLEWKNISCDLICYLRTPLF